MPVLGESEKARLQKIFEWSNRGIGIPEPNRWRDDDHTTNEEVQLIRKQMQGSVKKQKRWLDILAKEVVDRETVLKVMRAEGQEQLSKTKLRNEIQERIKRMKEIQNNIARQERQDKANKMEALLVDPTKCCQATYNVQLEKAKTESKARGSGYSSQSKRLLEHNLSTSEKPAANHRRYKHTHSPTGLPYKLGSSGIIRGLEQLIKENHHQHHKGNHHHHKENHHHYKENHHHHRENHHHYIDKLLDGDVKPSKLRQRTRCQSEKGLKNKIII